MSHCIQATRPRGRRYRLICALPSRFLRITASAVLATVVSLQVAVGELPPRIAAAMAQSADATRTEGERVKAIRRLGEGDYATVAKTLFDLIASSQPVRIRLIAVQALETLGQPECVAPLLAGWTNYVAAVKLQVLHTLTARRELAEEFLHRLESNAIPLGDVDAATRQRLANFPEGDIAANSQKIFARQPWLNAKATLERFRPALALKGDAVRGKEIFRERTCVNCHRIGDEGHFVGADLFTAKEMSREELLQQVVAPNLFFMPNFQAFFAETSDGELVEGVMAGGTDSTVTIRQALGIDRTFNRSSLKRLKGLNVSLMPEGLLEGLSHQQVADLLEFIKSLRGF